MIVLHFPMRLISKDNEKVFNRQGRPFLSPKFKQFEEKVRLFAMASGKVKLLEGDVSVGILARFTDKRHADALNLPKGAIDALQGIVFKNDRQIKIGKISVIEGAVKDDFTIWVNRL